MRDPGVEWARKGPWKKRILEAVQLLNEEADGLEHAKPPARKKARGEAEATPEQKGANNGKAA